MVFDVVRYEKTFERHRRMTESSPVDWLRKESDNNRDILLVIMNQPELDPIPTRHWMICWGTSSDSDTQHALHLPEEKKRARRASWCPKMTEKTTSGSKKIILVHDAPADTRTKWEDIANTHLLKALRVTGDFNSENWIREVLNQAVAQDLIAQAVADAALAEAARP